MTNFEKIAAQNITHAVNWIVGGYYNCIQDGCPEDLPRSKAELANEIYDSAMFNLYRPGMEGYGKAPREMRFAGEKFCREYIAKLLNDDGDVEEIAEAANW